MLKNMMERMLRDREKIMLHFMNAEGKEWMVPLEGTRTGLLLYQPSGWRGMLLKRMLPLIGRWNWGRKLLHSDIKRHHINQEIEEAITKAFGIEDFNYSIFFGTPCADQKVTIQVFQGKRVLGYCKVCDSEKVARNFQQEMELLHELNEKGVHSIPKGLAYGKTTEGHYYFAQSTTKNRQSTYPHEWGELQEEFVRDLNERTRVSMPYEQTDFYRAIQMLRGRMDWLSNEQQQTIGNAIEEINNHFCSKTVEWSIFHGDFTPWNTFVNDGQLFVFDWEYALRNCPPSLDTYHWFTQTRIFEKHYRTEQIFEDYQKKYGFSNNFLYLCYLILTIATYVGREVKPDDVKKITLLDTWTGLINRIMKR